MISTRYLLSSDCAFVHDMIYITLIIICFHLKTPSMELVTVMLLIFCTPLITWEQHCIKIFKVLYVRKLYILWVFMFGSLSSEHNTQMLEIHRMRA
jgi:hypothetical protein